MADDKKEVEDVVVRVDEEFKQIVDNIMSAAHKMKSERQKIEGVLGEMKKIVEETKVLVEDIRIMKMARGSK